MEGKDEAGGHFWKKSRPRAKGAPDEVGSDQPEQQPPAADKTGQQQSQKRLEDRGQGAVAPSRANSVCFVILLLKLCVIHVARIGFLRTVRNLESFTNKK